MSTTLDIAVCLDCTLSMSFYMPAIRSTLFSILTKLDCYDPPDVRLALIEFWSHMDPLTTQIHPFTSSKDVFRNQINAVQTYGGNIDGHKAIVDGLGAALNLDWRRNATDEYSWHQSFLSCLQDNSHRYHEKMVILFTDGPPCHLLDNNCPCDSADLWKMANTFDKENIVLMIIGIEPSVIVCDDFYCALANKTGGEYLPLINAARVLTRVIPRAIEDVHTLTQLFHRLDIRLDIEYNSMYHYHAVQRRVRYMYSECRTMSDIRRKLFTHRQRPGEVFIETNVDDAFLDFEPHSPPSGMSYIDRWLNPDINIIASTPVTDDEGYRSRLATTGSFNSSLIYQIGSPAFSHGSDIGWTIGGDDPMF